MKKIFVLLFLGMVFSSFAQKLKPLYDSFSSSWGYVDKAGMWVVSPMFEAAENFSTDKKGFAAVQQNKRWGCINDNGTFIVEPVFNYSSEAIEALRHQQKNNKKQNNNWLFLLQEPESQTWGFVDCYGIWTIKPVYEFATDFNDYTYKRYATVQWNGKWGCIDDKGEVIVKPVFETQDQATDAGYQWHKNEVIGVWLYPAQNADGVWGYVNYRGDWAVKPIFEYAKEFVGDRYNRCAVVKIDGSWGCIDDRGKYVVDPKYPYAGQATRAGFDWRKSK